MPAPASRQALSSRWIYYQALGPLLVFSLLLQTAEAQQPRLKPSLWISPPGIENGRHLRELFEKPDQWKDTRPLVDVLFYTDLNFDRQFSDDDLRAWFGMLKQWNIKVAMEVGAIKEWGQTGEKTFNAERPKWERLERLGADLYAIAMDEPLDCVRAKLHQSDEYAAEETAKYLALVREHFPKLLVGDIETYPTLSVEEHQQWIDSLQKHLADKQIKGLDFYRLDVDWVRFTVTNKGSWKEVKQIEQICRQRQIPFSLIYWASGFPSLQKKGVADDSTWYVSIMQQGYDYLRIGGAPDQYVIESWIGAPSQPLPETGDWTFMRSVRDFARKFVK